MYLKYLYLKYCISLDERSSISCPLNSKNAYVICLAWEIISYIRQVIVLEEKAINNSTPPSVMVVHIFL